LRLLRHVHVDSLDDNRGVSLRLYDGITKEQSIRGNKGDGQETERVNFSHFVFLAIGRLSLGFE
jgi:hypothetical protein